MADTGSGRTDPFADVISLVAGPIAAVIRSFDQLRKGADELMRGLENFNATMEQPQRDGRSGSTGCSTTSRSRSGRCSRSSRAP